ncbi:class I SAM-dependent methyltransferase [Metasolibacillus meyeri]|uniref:Class I SAM-dependent methyltransferase n=1 Tax=Metasolibacillus meyeri TaxID=1071052 RepID=A0AAW9NL04_9BACL|nr:class I SAM-dependent methyltransferase [Metasolibacillus meyeri]MEC1178065.1 class I SAM-dependent methyltransferase [Metasolibacillus meyeri]
MKEHEFEKLLRIHTAGFQYGFPKLTHYHRYEPTPYAGLEQLFDEYILPDNAVFVDVGCGKGRVPIYIHYRFHIPVVGIEMDEKFFVEAQHNKETYLEKAKKKHVPIAFFHMLAERYSVKSNENVFFFFNPFSLDIFRKVVANILHSFEYHPRNIHIILYYPAIDYLFYLEQDTPFTLHREVRLKDESNANERICVYTLLF